MYHWDYARYQPVEAIPSIPHAMNIILCVSNDDKNKRKK